MPGGNAGIGFALCKQLCEQGCHVYLCSRSLDKGEAAVKQIMAAGQLKGKPLRAEDGLKGSGKCELVQLDTSSDASVAKAVEAVKGREPGMRLAG